MSSVTIGPEGEWVEIPAQHGYVAKPGVGTVLINPAELGVDGPAEVHAINERLFRQVLREHYARVEIVDDFGTAFVECHCDADGAIWELPEQQAINAWIDHIMRVAAVTPDVIED